FAVAWNGLVYPLAALGVGANLEDDVRAILERARKDRESRRNLPFGPRGDAGWEHSLNGGTPHSLMAGHEALVPAKTCLLLRLGKADLAEALYEAGTGQPADAIPPISQFELNYLSLSSAWVWAMLDRALEAHANSNDLLARVDLRALSRLVPMVEAKCAEMG